MGRYSSPVFLTHIRLLVFSSMPGKTWAGKGLTPLILDTGKWSSNLCSCSKFSAHFSALIGHEARDPTGKQLVFSGEADFWQLSYPSGHCLILGLTVSIKLSAFRYPHTAKPPKSLITLGGYAFYCLQPGCTIEQFFPQPFLGHFYPI